MADPIQTSLSLDTLSSEYTVFEADQVLTEAQLNTLSSYFDDQDRLTRVELLGVGIVGGLNVVLSGNTVIVGKGVGITTDGDLMLLGTDTIYDCIKPYTESAPVYPAFYTGSTMMTLFELVAQGESDVNKQDMSTLPGKLTDYAVIFYMESYQQDSDLCSGSDCDNLGLSAMHTPRMLLVGLADAEKLLKPLTTAADAAAQLSYITADRIKLTTSIDSVGKLASAYLGVCTNIHTKLIGTLNTLNSLLPGLVIEQFGSNPIGGWIGKLNSFYAAFANAANANKPSIQYYYSFLKDVAEAWDDLRSQLFANTSVLCPDLSAFPKHLLLGALNAPETLRTRLYPSPLTGDSRGAHEHVRFLVSKLHVMFNTVALPVPVPTSNPIRITPSRDERVSLEERAIPFYYVDNGSFHIQAAWNHALSASQSQQRTTAYRWADYAGQTAPDFFAIQIGRYDFFRIEGHQGQNITTALNAINSLIQTNNLPFAARTVLLHNDKTKIVIRPPRYSDIHRIHYMLRNEVSTQLNYGKIFSQDLSQKLSDAVGTSSIPATINNQPVVSYAKAQSQQVSDAVDKVMPAVTQKKYSDYLVSTKTQSNWTASYQTAVEAAGTFKSTLGEIARTDFTTPLDTMVVSNQSAWLNWLDLIIDKKNDHEDDKLLMTNFFQQFPGIEHAGGVARGGTFVLVYDDTSNVVADFMLPFYAPETGTPEPSDEPDLSIPSYRPIDGIIGKGVTLLQPTATLLSNLSDQLKGEWQKDINVQTGYMDFFSNNIKTIGDVLGKFNATSDLGISTGNSLLDTMVSGMNEKQKLIDDLSNSMAQMDPSSADMASAQGMLDRYQNELADDVGTATQYVVVNNIDTSAGKAGAQVVNAITSSVRSIKSDTATKQLQSSFTSIGKNATKSQVGMINTIGRIGGLSGF